MANVKSGRLASRTLPCIYFFFLQKKGAWVGHLSEAAVAKFCSDTDLRLGNCRHGNREGGGLESPRLPSPAVPTSEVVSEFKASLETVSLWSLTSEAEAAAAAVASRGLGTLR